MKPETLKALHAKWLKAAQLPTQPELRTAAEVYVQARIQADQKRDLACETIEADMLQARGEIKQWNLGSTVSARLILASKLRQIHNVHWACFEHIGRVHSAYQQFLRARQPFFPSEQHIGL